MPEPISESRKRPTIITVFCVIGFISGFISLGLTLLSSRDFNGFSVETYGAWYMPFVVVNMILYLVSVVGYWKMRKWGVYLYTALFAIGTIVGVVAGVPFTILGVIVPIAVIIIGFTYLKGMR